MSRCRLGDIAFTYDGLIVKRVPNATVTVYAAGTSTPYSGTIWKNATGTDPADEYTNPFTTGSDGSIVFYLTVNEPLKIVVTGTDLGTLTSDYVYPTAAPGDIPTADKTGAVYLLDYAAGFDIAHGDVSGSSADVAWSAADVHAVLLGRMTIIVPPGVYLTRYYPSDGITIQGSGKGVTILKHQNGDATPTYRDCVINAVGRSNVTILDLSVDGNYTQNNDTANGWGSSEVALDGTNNRAYNVEVYDANHSGFTYGGDHNVLENCDAYRVTVPVSYPVSDADHNYGMIYGFFSSSYTLNRDLWLINCRAWNIRSAGIVIGGERPTLVNPVALECHLGEYPVGVPGGSIATGYSWDGTGDPTDIANAAHLLVRPKNVRIIAPHVGPSTINDNASGIEISVADGVEIIGPEVIGVPGFAIAITDSTAVSIIGGNLNGTYTTITSTPPVTTNIGNGGIRVNASSVRVTGTTIQNMVNNNGSTPTAVQLQGTGGEATLTGCVFKNNTDNWLDTTSGATLISHGHRVIGTGGAVPQQILGELNTTAFVSGAFALTVQNLHANGDGLDVAAASTAAEWIARFRTYNGALTAFEIKGTGQSWHTSSEAFPVIFNSTHAASNQGVTIQRSGSNKAVFGIDSADNPTIHGAAATPLLTVDKTTGVLSGTGLVYGTFTPTVDQTTTGITLSTTQAEYMIIGKTAFVNINLVVSGSGSGSVAINLKSIPAAIQPRRTGTFTALGGGVIFDTSASIPYVGHWVATAASTWGLVVNAAAGNYVGATPAFNLANGDTISASLAYEIP